MINERQTARMTPVKWGILVLCTLFALMILGKTALAVLAPFLLLVLVLWVIARVTESEARRNKIDGVKTNLRVALAVLACNRDSLDYRRVVAALALLDERLRLLCRLTGSGRMGILVRLDVFPGTGLAAVAAASRYRSRLKPT